MQFYRIKNLYTHVREDLKSSRKEYKHLQCDYRIKNPYTQSIGIANPDETTTTTNPDEPTTTTNQDE